MRSAHELGFAWEKAVKEAGDEWTFLDNVDFFRAIQSEARRAGLLEAAGLGLAFADVYGQQADVTVSAHEADHYRSKRNAAKELATAIEAAANEETENGQ